MLETTELIVNVPRATSIDNIDGWFGVQLPNQQYSGYAEPFSLPNYTFPRQAKFLLLITSSCGHSFVKKKLQKKKKKKKKK